MACKRRDREGLYSSGVEKCGPYHGSIEIIPISWPAIPLPQIQEQFQLIKQMLRYIVNIIMIRPGTCSGIYILQNPSFSALHRYFRENNVTIQSRVEPGVCFSF